MIWVVTDHQATNESLVPLIAAKGYPVAYIECGDEVHKRMQFQSPKVVVIDCGMPDSFETLAKIRSEQKTRATPVIMFSQADEDLKQKALLRGADSYVGKGSLDWLELLAEIARLAGPAR